MPKMRGILHPKPKIDEAEMALAASRTAARLEQLFGEGSEDADEDQASADDSPDALDTQVGAEATGTPPSPSVEPGPWGGGRRPPIVVAGAEESAGAEDEVELVGVMARPGEDMGSDAWELPAAASTVPADPDVRGVEGLVPAARAGGIESEVIAFLVEAAIEQPFEGQVAGGQVGIAVGPAPVRPDRKTPARPKAGSAAAARATKGKSRPARVAPAHCPYCALLLEPPPASSRRCTRCRQRIVVKRVEGRAVYLTEAAVLVFEAERQRIATSRELTRERERWLRLAAAASAPEQRIARLAAAPITADSVAAARALYVSTMDRAFAVARRAHDWETASRIRRDHATALYRIAGSPLPPPADLVAVFREGVASELRGIAEISRDAELVGATCCPACKADDRRIFRIATELRSPRLPHVDCPKGLCRCAWDLAARDRSTIRKYLRKSPRAESRATTRESTTTA